MKINKTVKIVGIVSAAFVLFAQAYFGLILPALNVLYNPVRDPQVPSDQTPGTIIHHGDSGLIDIEKYTTPTPELTPTPGPGETVEPTEEPTAEPTEEPIGKGEVGKLKIVRASTLTFEKGTKNILLLGYNPDEGLCDSIFVVNINETTKKMMLVSMPRDIFVPYGDETVNAMKKTGYYYSPGCCKINAAMYVGNTIVKYEGGKFGNSGIDFLCAVLSQLLPGVSIDEYVFVDFDGFMDIVDAVGGVTVTAPENMYKDTGELIIREGTHKLSSREALFYVRYRTRLDATGKDTGRGGDEFRKTNQANFLVEVSKQIITTDNMTYGKITDMMGVLKKSVFHSVTLEDLSTYLPIGLSYAKGNYSIQPYVITGIEADPLGDDADYLMLN